MSPCILLDEANFVKLRSISLWPLPNVMYDRYTRGDIRSTRLYYRTRRIGNSVELLQTNFTPQNEVDVVVCTSQCQINTPQNWFIRNTINWVEIGVDKSLSRSTGLSYRMTPTLRDHIDEYVLACVISWGVSATDIPHLCHRYRGSSLKTKVNTSMIWYFIHYGLQINNIDQLTLVYFLL